MDLSRKKTIHAVICLSPLIPALLMPGNGVLVSLAIVGLTLLLIAEARQGTFPLIHKSVFRSVLIGISVGVILHCAFYFVVDPVLESLAGSEIDLENFDAVTGNLVNYLILLAIGLIFGGIIEELIFRGFVIGWGTRIFGERSAYLLAFLAAFAFGAAHLYQGVPGVVSTGLTGLILGILYISLGRKLLPVMVAHMTLNAIGITLIYLGLY